MFQSYIANLTWVFNALISDPNFKTILVDENKIEQLVILLKSTDVVKILF